VTVPTTEGGYVGRQPRSDAGSTVPRRNDPFQRRGVVSAPPLPMRPNLPRAEPEAGSDSDDSWSPEPLHRNKIFLRFLLVNGYQLTNRVVSRVHDQTAGRRTSLPS
jgi:hypothetical protein